jgi:general secretion pathway protein F
MEPAMQFHVRLFDPTSGQVRELLAEAPDESNLRARLAAFNEVVVALRPRGGVATWLARAQRPRFDVGVLCVELSRLLRAGLTLPEAVETQAGRVEGRARVVYTDLQARLLEGKRLSEAMRLADAFPPVLVAAVRASERSGRVPEALEEFARYDAALRELRRKMINAAIYPSLVVGFGFLVSLFLLGYVVPRFALIFSERVAQTSQATSVLIKLGQVINSHPWSAVGSLMAAVVSIAMLAANPSVRGGLVSVMERLRPIERWLRTLQLARITHSMAMLLKNGFPVPEAMGLASALALRPDVMAAIEQATGSIEAGQSTSVAWSGAGLADPYATRILQAGERTGNLAACFDTLAQTYRLDVETALERASRILEPLLLVIVAALIGLIVVLMYMPIFDLASSVG